MKYIVCINSLGNNEVSVIRFSSEIAICLTEIYTSPFMQVTGYPHFKNVCSNILAFSFDLKEEYNFNDLFIRLLLETAGEEMISNGDTVVIEREFYISCCINLTGYIFKIYNPVFSFCFCHCFTSFF